MELNQVEMMQVEKTVHQVACDAIKELADLQLVLVGGGCEVSFN